MLDLTTIPVAFNMTLANAPTSERFCYEAAAMLGEEINSVDAAYLDHRMGEFDGENISEIVREWTDKLSAAGYCAIWNAGDVVVYDLRGLTDDERDEFYAATATF